MKDKKKFLCMMLLMAGFALSSCEKMVVDEPESPTKVKTEEGNVTLRVTGFNVVPFDTRAVQDLTTYCTRLNFVVYKDGSIVDSKAQAQGDDNYGTVTMKLEPGTYKLLVLAHSSKGGNPAVTNPENIQFTNALGFSDTFYFYDDLVVTSEAKTHDIAMTRAVSMLRFIVEDPLPSDVNFMSFSYTGGSGTLNAVTGYGVSTSTPQEALYNVSGLTSPVPMRIYTFLPSDEGKIQLTVRALAADKATVIAERSFADVPMKRNMVTEYKGSFFTIASSNGFSLTAETDWETYNSITY